MSTAVKIEKLRCVDPQDSLTDEVKMQQDGRQVWPNTGDGFFSMSRETEVPMNLRLTFDGESTRITLFDDEDIGSDDNLGSINIRRDESAQLHSQDIVGPGSRYTLSYKVKDLGDF
jgi:hypothetical protein